MPHETTRRQFLAHVGAVAAGAAVGGIAVPGCAGEPERDETSRPAPRVVIARDEQLTRGKLEHHRELLGRLLDAAMQKLTNAPSGEEAWQKTFSRRDRVGIKVNTLGLSTQPAVVDALVAGLRRAGLPAENVTIWDRFDVELANAGFKLNKSGRGVQCRGTDAEHYGTGYQSQVESSGQIGSCFSKIVAEQVDVLISVPVLKDHNLAGVSLGMKNFFGAIHNPNKYHEQNCDPYVADVVAHRYIRPKWRLTVCDATHAQYHAGPGRHPGYAWPLGGLTVRGAFVAADAVAADLLEQQRQAKGLRSLEQENRPAKHIATAGARKFGVADLSKIERIEV
jgi:uncharacterized protein (DUF362 family)